MRAGDAFRYYSKIFSNILLGLGKLLCDRQSNRLLWWRLGKDTTAREQQQHCYAY
ncbi:MAG: hypothetical protein AAFR18_23175 [Cyanobacteria bacterium J06627_32]